MNEYSQTVKRLGRIFKLIIRAVVEYRTGSISFVLASNTLLRNIGHSIS